MQIKCRIKHKSKTQDRLSGALESGFDVSYSLYQGNYLTNGSDPAAEMSVSVTHSSICKRLFMNRKIKKHMIEQVTWKISWEAMNNSWPFKIRNNEQSEIFLWNISWAACFSNYN